MQRLLALIVPIVATAVIAGQPAAPAADAFAFFAPTVAVSGDDRQHLARGEPVAHTIDASGNEVAVFAAVPVTADADRLLRWMRAIAELKRSPYVLAIGRFSGVPQVTDVAPLTLEDDDVDAVRRCRPGRCSVKLTAPEIAELQRAIGDAGAGWRSAVQATFRQVVVARAKAYLNGGQAAIGTYADGADAPPLDAAFAALLQHTPFLAAHAPAVVECLQRPSCAPAPGVESFLYWSKERFNGKPVISATHVVMAHGAAAGGLEVLVAGKQVFATHYMDGSLGVTALTRDPDRRYLVYLNRSDVDLLGGMWGGLVRLILERRLASEAPKILIGLRQRIEGGAPAS